MLKQLEINDFDKIYKIMEDSFPVDERRTYDEQKALLSNPSYYIYVEESDDLQGIQGFMAVWQFDEVAFIEHFAVDVRFRNSGIGSRMLQYIRKIISGRICLEVELPHNDIAKNRISFYERNGFTYNNYQYVQPSISIGRNPIPLRIMTTDGGLNSEEFNEIKNLLYDKVYNVAPDYVDSLYYDPSSKIL